MKQGTYKELTAELDQRVTCRTDMYAAKSLLEKHKIIVKAIDSRIDFCNRRIKELRDSLDKLQRGCQQHNWVSYDREDGLGFIDSETRCSKCGKLR